MIDNYDAAKRGFKAGFRAAGLGLKPTIPWHAAYDDPFNVGWLRGRFHHYLGQTKEPIFRCYKCWSRPKYPGDIQVLSWGRAFCLRCRNKYKL
jgi:hypothetical protein